MTQEPGSVTDEPTHDMLRVRMEQITLLQDPTGHGSGVVVGADGLILTNRHVAPSVGPYRIILANGTSTRGVGVHQSAHHDLAVVKVVTNIGSFLDLEHDVADDIHVGDEVFALGHPRGCRLSVARGIISNPYQEFDKEYYVQTDVSINPGNSGGPLVDRQGKLVGVVSMTLSNSQGLGFAVPGPTAADYVRHVRRLVRHGVVRIPEALLSSRVDDNASVIELLHAAIGMLVAAGKAQIEQEEPEQGYVKLRQKSVVTEVRLLQGALHVWAQIGTLGPSEANNPKFLLKLLELAGAQQLGGANLSVSDNAVHIKLLRDTEGLTTTEVVRLVDRVMHLAVDLPSQIHGLLFGSVGAQGTPSTADPGYPLLAIPMGPYNR